MSDEKASINSKHSGMEESTPAVAPHEQMTGWRRVYYSPLIQIFLLGFILFMYVSPDRYSSSSYWRIRGPGLFNGRQWLRPHKFVARLNCPAPHLRSPKRCVPFSLLVTVV